MRGELLYAVAFGPALLVLAIACQKEEDDPFAGKVAWCPEDGRDMVTDLMYDPDHCGECGHACGQDNACDQGACVADRNRPLWPIPELPLSDDHYEVEDETVIDVVTGLEWQRHAAGRMPWDTTIPYCDSLELDGGGWRVPTWIELATIVDFTRRLPAINEGVFPVPDDEAPWGSEPDAIFCTALARPAPNLVFKHRAFPPDYDCEDGQFGDRGKLSECDSAGQSIDFMEGTRRYYDYSAGELTDCTPLEQFVRCVRGGVPEEPVTQRYEIEDGTALDVYTRLRWQRFIPECGAADRCEQQFATLEEAQAYCEDLVVDDYDDFRVPSITELYSVLWEDVMSHNGMDAEAFPEELDDIELDFYSSTPYARSDEAGGVRPWIMSFSSRQGTYMIGAFRVRCVRTED